MLGALEVDARVLQLGLRAGDVGLGAAQRRRYRLGVALGFAQRVGGALDVGLGLLHHGGALARLEPRQELPAADARALARLELDDLAAHRDADRGDRRVEESDVHRVAPRAARGEKERAEREPKEAGAARRRGPRAASALREGLAHGCLASGT
ncbi:MAG: hypothetical protein U1A78_20560 [Polyangia bacterium]